MSEQSSKEIRSKITSESVLELSIFNGEMPTPGENDVLIKVEGSPINPSDLGLLISFAADLDTLVTFGSGDEAVTTMKIHLGLMSAMKPRLDDSMQVGSKYGIYVAGGAMQAG